ncbi:PAS domain S-box protein [Sphingobacterium multivorum]|uniref:PAS domain S-box protein n=1 Tax=Sphingobacterium multivorum TaxID=28454 RepID=UPI0028B1A2E1|nr:PAS domain S-box protein [Sphingobacterium multivorum]
MNSSEQMEQLRIENLELNNRITELTDFIDSASLALHWVNREGVIIWANQAELDLLGYRKEEYIGFPIAGFHTDQDTISKILHMLLNNQRVEDYPASLRCKNGDIKHVVINSSALMKDDEFVHSMCFAKDVTEAVLAEKRRDKLTAILQEKEERLRLAIASTGLGTWDWDAAKGIVQLSPQAQEILELSAPIQKKEAMITLIHPEDQPAIFQQMRGLSENKMDGHFEFTCRIIRPITHGIAFVKLTGSAFFSGSKESRRIIGALMDVTDQKKATEKSAELAAIVNSSYDAIIGKTLDGIITSWNDAATNLFGYSNAEMIGQSILKLIPRDRHSEEDYILGRMRMGHSIKHFETVRQTKSGKLVDLSLTISPIKNDLGEIIGVSKIARDISEKKQEEKRKNTFISVASHELKTPLTTVLMSAQMMQQHATIFGEKSAQIGTKIESQVRKMMLMIADFLSITEVDEGKLQLHQTIFQLDKLMRDCINDLETNRHSIELRCDPTVHILADWPKMDQVFANLLNNAIKYSPHGGTIIIGTQIIGEKVRIYVQDEGIGIEPKHQKNIFKSFYRVDNLNTSNISGFGIGLYLVAEILRKHGSQIHVQSAKDKGSIFYFDFPFTYASN